MSLARRLLAGWIAIAAHFGFVQTWVMLGLFYVTLVGPAAIATRLAGQDLLNKRERSPEGSAWQESDAAAPDLERAQRMT